MTAEKRFAATANAENIIGQNAKERKEGAMETETMNSVWSEIFRLIPTQSSNQPTCPNCGEPVKLSGKRKANWVIKDGEKKYICIDQCKKLKDH